MNDVAALIYDSIVWLWTLDGFRAILLTIGASVGLAVAAAIYDTDDKFSFKKFFEFLWRKVVPFGVLYGAAKAISVADPAWAWLNEVAGGAMMTNLSISIADNLRILGLPIPEDIADKSLAMLRSK